MKNRRWASLIAALITGTAHADIPPPAYQLATYGTEVPSEVLYALALQESGTRLRGKLVPWPWTLNVAKVSYRYSSREAACSALLLAIKQVGAKRVDAGLGQLNIGWQRERFAEPCDVLDPYLNLMLTTRVLQEQKTTSNSWVEAAGRYHRPAGGAPAARYRQGFTRHLQRVAAATDNPRGFP